MVPIGGKLGDRFGRKPMPIGGAAFFLATTLVCGLGQIMPQLMRAVFYINLPFALAALVVVWRLFPPGRL